MATNNFNSDPTNDSFEPLMSYFDSQGVNRLESANISSYGFDGFIPTVIQNRTASGILPGMAISLTGSSTGQNFYKVLSNNVGDRAFTASPSNEIVIEYLDNDQLVQVLSASVNDIFSVSYENWDGKDLGSTGWYLGNSGNAIFSNVAVRGRIEATEGVLEGDLTLGGSLTASNNNGLLQVSSSGIFGTASGNSLIYNNITGQVSISGDIVANSGKINDLDIGPNPSSILNIVGVNTASSTISSSQSGLFIMTSTVYKDNLAQVFNRRLQPGDVFKLSNVFSTSSYSHGGINPYTGQLYTYATDTYISASVFHVHSFKVISASYSEYDGSIFLPGWGTYGHYINRYLCQIYYPNVIPHPFGDYWNFAGVTASSGSFNIGYMFLGQDNQFNSGVDNLVTLEGVSLVNYKRLLSDPTYNEDIPDFIDLSGNFKLGAGNIKYNNNTLSVIGNINALSGSISGDLKLGGSLTASTNVGQIILSSSGIFGSTASGSFNLNTISGQINITGQINAESGEISYLTVGDNNFPILNIVGASWVNTEGFSGAIVLSVYQYAYNPDIPYFPNSGFQYPSTEAHLVQRYMAAGDYFQLSGVSASGIGYNNSASLSQSALNNYLNGQYKVLTASLAQINYSSSAVFDRYFCTRVQPFEMSMPNLDFSNVTASSGSYTNGFLFFGEYNVKNGSAITRIDGVTFSSIKPGTTWNTYIPDFIDLSGRLRLANGLIRNTLTTASQTTNGLYVRGSIQNIRPVFNITASAVLISSNNPKDPTEINLETSRSNFIYEITPVGGSCVVTIFNSSFPIGEEFTVINTGTSGNIYFTMDPTSASINAVKNITVLSGQWNQATLRKRQDFSWLLSLDK